MNSRTLTMTSIAALGASLTMVGCTPRDQDRARNDGRDTVAQADQKARSAGNDASRGMDRAKDATRDMAQDTKVAGKNAGDKVADAVITTSVKAELATDANLSALKVNVDTDNGRVALRGTAPSPQAREHATALAQGVKGVVGVDNELTVAPASK